MTGLRELRAPAQWHTLDFISDVHLQADAPQTLQLWARYMAQTPADALFILGDLFEVWVGDDLLTAGDSGIERCAEALRQCGQRLSLFLMHGNRDFLMGQAFAAHCHATLLDDPCTLIWGDQRWLLSHGDALCVDDTDYQAFRQQVRGAAWQHAFLAKPLHERQSIARHLREQSQEQQALRHARDGRYAEVDAQAARQALQAASAGVLIHGHTHRPARHALGDGLSREVLSDWDAQAKPPRAQVLRLNLQGKPADQVQRLALV